MKTHFGAFTMLVVSMLSVMACNRSADKANAQKWSSYDVEMDGWMYDRDKGTPAVAPEMTKMLMDAQGIVMYELVMKPGDSLDWHEHPYHTMYVMQGGTLAVYYKDGTKEVLKLQDGTGMWGLPNLDTTVNIGDTTVKLLMHDIYSLGSFE